MARQTKSPTNNAGRNKDGQAAPDTGRTGAEPKLAQVSSGSGTRPDAERDRQDETPLEDWTLERLRGRASEAGVPGGARMNKEQLIEALRDG